MATSTSLSAAGDTAGQASGDARATEAAEDGIGAEDATGTTVVISPHHQCFDRYLREEPAVTNEQQYFVEPPTGEPFQLNQLWPAVRTTNHALFVLEDGRAVAAVKFSYSKQDVLSIHEVRDAECGEVAWKHDGNDLVSSERHRSNRATMSLTLADGSAYRVVLEVRDVLVQPQGLVVYKEYYAHVHEG